MKTISSLKVNIIAIVFLSFFSFIALAVNPCLAQILNSKVVAIKQPNAFSTSVKPVTVKPVLIKPVAGLGDPTVDPEAWVPQGYEPELPSVQQALQSMDEHGIRILPLNGEIDGAFQYHSDRDYYIIRLLKPGKLRIAIEDDGGSLLNSGVLYDRNGNVVCKKWQYHKKTGTILEVSYLGLPLLTLPAGNYRLEITGGVSNPDVIRVVNYTLGTQFLPKPENRALVVLIENGGNSVDLPEIMIPTIDFAQFDLFDRSTWGKVEVRFVDLGAMFEKKFRELTDHYIETLTGNSIHRACSPFYDRVEIIEDEDFNQENILHLLSEIKQCGEYVVDIHVLAHGATGFFCGYDGVNFYGSETISAWLNKVVADDPELSSRYADGRDYAAHCIGSEGGSRPDVWGGGYEYYEDVSTCLSDKEGINGVDFFDRLRGNFFDDLFIGAVYQQNCKAGSLLDEWLAVGAEVVNGSRANNYMPLSYSVFLIDWLEGATFGEAVQFAYDSTLEAHNFLYSFIDDYDEVAGEYRRQIDITGNLSSWEEVDGSRMIMQGDVDVTLDMGN